MIEELLRYTPADLQDLDRLMGELSAASYCDREILDRLMDDAGSHLYVMRDGNHIIACACLCRWMSIVVRIRLPGDVLQ